MAISQFPDPLDKYTICTSSTRPSGAYEGLMIYESDTNRAYIFDGTTWQPVMVGRRIAAGTFSGSTDAGGNIIIAHGLGVTPTAVTAMLTASGNTAAVLQVCVLTRGGIDATNFVIYTHRSDSPVALTGAVTFDWIAVA